MNNHFPTRHYLTVLAGVTTLIIARSADAAPTPPKAAPAAVVVTSNAMPKSIFIIPTNAKQGRDPFFPDSQRFLASAPTTNAAPVSTVSPSAFVLQGISGTADQRLAIINGRTLAEGEETEVTVSGTRLRFRCLEIKADAVVIEIGTERRELRLRPGF